MFIRQSTESFAFLFARTDRLKIWTFFYEPLFWQFLFCVCVAPEEFMIWDSLGDDFGCSFRVLYNAWFGSGYMYLRQSRRPSDNDTDFLHEGGPRILGSGSQRIYLWTGFTLLTLHKKKKRLLLPLTCTGRRRES